MHTTMTEAFLRFIGRNDWLVNASIVMASMFLFHFISRRTYHFLLAKFDTDKHVWSISLIKSVHVPWLTFFWVFAVSFVLPDFSFHSRTLPSEIQILNSVRSFFFVLAIYWSLWNFINNMERKIMPHWGRRDKTTVRAVAQLSRVAVVILFILSMLPMLGFETSSLLAFGGVGGIAVGFAAKDTLSNFLGGMMIFWDRPFAVGDWIRSPDRNIEGTVEHIGWRLTRIRSLDKRPMYVPNGIFSTIIIENPERMSHRQVNTMIGVRYDDITVVVPIVKKIP